MRLSRRGPTLAVAWLCGWLLAGCDNSTKNEQNLFKSDKVRVPPGSEQFSSFGEYQKHISELSKKKAKESKSKGKGSSK